VRILHALPLQQVGGIETLFRGYLGGTRDVGLAHHVLGLKGLCHPALAEVIGGRAASVQYVKYLAGVKLPRWPAALRRAHLGRIFARVRPDVTVLHNRLAERWVWPAAGRAGSVRIHYEHGSAWWTERGKGTGPGTGDADVVVCCSHAARRMLELRWGFEAGRMRVVLNGVRPDLEATGEGKPAPRGRRLRLGMAARLMRVKGVPLALHALKRLRAGGLDCELHVAGTGEDAAALKRLAGRLELSGAVIWHELVRDMSAFYPEVDILLCPSVVEPFGTVCSEAAAFGTPVVATAVDGLVESVEPGVTGFCVPATLEMAEYEALGGHADVSVEFVYDPIEDGLREPGVPAPEKLAEAVNRLASDAGLYERMSAAAAQRAREQFGFERYVRELDEVFRAAAEGRGDG
jgi:glycosyltransferase involved in cell wall biosynthesis